MGRMGDMPPQIQYVRKKQCAPRKRKKQTLADGVDHRIERIQN